MLRKASAMTLLSVFLIGLTSIAGREAEAQSPTPVIVDINSASRVDLEAVVMDSGLAQRIIDNRPYANKRQLLTRSLVSMEQYDAIKDRIVARRVETPEGAQ